MRKANPRDLILGGKCINGHKVTEESLGYNPNTERRWCRECARASRERYKEEINAGKRAKYTVHGMTNRKFVVELGAQLTVEDSGLSIDLRSLQIKQDARPSYERLKDATREDTGRNCAGREDEFINYEEDDEPDTRLCDDCPVFSLCKDYSLKEKPGWGLYGGQVWRYGKVVK